jgi:hypothetical protein
MKLVKFFSVFLLGLFFMTPSLHASSGGKGKVEIVITSKTSPAQLDSLKKAATAQGMTIDVDGTVYTNTGTLKQISGTVTVSEKVFGTFKSSNVGTITITKKGNKLNINVADPTAAQ